MYVDCSDAVCGIKGFEVVLFTDAVVVFDAVEVVVVDWLVVNRAVVGFGVVLRKSKISCNKISKKQFYFDLLFRDFDYCPLLCNAIN